MLIEMWAKEYQCQLLLSSEPISSDLGRDAATFFTPVSQKSDPPSVIPLVPSKL